MWILRRWVQSAATILSNASLMFLSTRNIYQGRLKSMCVPGLNCYSCPAATGACPLGSLQTLFASVKPGLESGRYHFGLYVIGFLGIIGSLVGRMPCAWLCPFGFLQELIYKIPSRKFEIPKYLIYVKYVFLAFFIVLLPAFVLDEFGYGMTWFCKYVCPAGTLEAGIPMMLLQPSLQELIGILFYNKLIILIVFLLLMIIIKRPFCRIACPLGAIYSLFNKFSIFRMVHDPDACVRCKQCYRDCPMGVRFYEKANHIDCIRCMKCYQESCQYGAISYEVAGIPIRPVPKKGEDEAESPAS